MFRSRAPINDDPQPYYVQEADRRYTEAEVRESAGEGEHGGIIWNLARRLPRAEYDRTHLSPVNPALVALRDMAERHGMDRDEVVNLAGNFLRNERLYLTRLHIKATVRQLAHARRVLSLLRAAHAEETP